MNETDLLELERQKLKLILSLIDDAVVLVDTSQTVSYINHQTEELLDLKLPEVLGKNVGDVIVLLDSQNSLVPSINFAPVGDIDIEGAVYKSHDLKLVDSKNKVKNVAVETRKMRGGSQIGLGCVVVIKNVAQKQELENMKIDFTSMAVHVLRTPLTVLRGYLNALSQGGTVSKLNESEIDNLNNAIAGANELNTLIEDLLHLSEISQGSFKIFPTPINYEGLVSSVVLSYQTVAKSKGLHIVYNPPLYEFPTIRGDVERIKELLSNLLSNAIKFTDHGFIEVKVSHDQTNITTVVSDTGKGIAKEKQGLVFQKFYREKENPLEMASGYGLGLFISSKIVEAHKGKIWLESKENVGSSFYFSLPISL